ncbi:MAG: substrate-binding domain-containing protein, partial [Verrucomicrobiota bacterium]
MTRKRKVVTVMSHVAVLRYVPGFILAKRPDIVVWQLNVYHEMELMLDKIREWEPDVLIIEYLPGITEELMELEIPKVVIQYDYEVGFQVCSIDVDDGQVGRLAGEFFLGKRLENFAYYGKAVQWSEQRLAGFGEVIGKSGGSVSTFIEPQEGGPSRYAEYWPNPTEELIEWLKELPKPCGLLAGHDPLGRAILEACVLAEVEVPREVAVLGVNDDPLVCLLSDPKLSSV